MNEEKIRVMSQLFKTLSDPTRLSILLLLREGECNVGRIATTLNKEQSAISHQLQLLRKHHLVRTRRDGKTIYYRLDDDHVQKLLMMMDEHVSHHLKNNEN